MTPLERADKVRQEIADHDCEPVADDLCPPGSLILTPDDRLNVLDAGNRLYDLVQGALSSQRLGLIQGTASEGALNRWNVALALLAGVGQT